MSYPRSGRETRRSAGASQSWPSAQAARHVPLQVGDWKGTLGEKLDERTRKAAEAEGDTQIVYVNDKTGERVKVFIVCGRLMGVMEAPRPDRCYPAHGYKESGERMQQTVRTGTKQRGPKAQFQTAAYVRDGLPDARLFWSWSSDGVWKCLMISALTFCGTKPVFKVHFESEVVDPKQLLDQTPSVSLIKALIPELSRALFPDFKPSTPADASADFKS